ncbi:Gfo/Idh/MocA family protein [Thermodesulfobacteriota bacterium]
MEIKEVKKDKIRVGVVGVGHLGEYHVQKYKALPNVELVGVVDINPDRANEIGQRYDTRAYHRHHEILKRVDAVSLAVPTTAHFEVAKDILSEGIHLLVEKPITYKIEPADTLINMASERDLVLQVGLVERFNPAVIKMMSLLKDPVFIEAHRMNIFTQRGTDTDVVLDLMIHELDIILHMVSSEVKELHAVGMSVVTGMTDIANVRMIFENGVVANISASRVSHKNIRKIRVYQPNLYTEADCLKRSINITRLDNGKGEPSNFHELRPETVAYPNNDPLADEIVSFVDAVTNGSKPVVSGKDGRKALEVSLEIIDLINGRCREFRAVD